MAKKEETDYAAMEKLVMDAKDNLDSLVGMELTNQDNIRMGANEQDQRSTETGS